MLEALPRNPKATGKKLLGIEERTGSVVVQEGRRKAARLTCPYSKAQTLAPGTAATGPWEQTCPGLC